MVTLQNGTTINIESAIYAPKAVRNLISFKDIRANHFHIQTNTEEDKEIMNIITGNKIKETFTAYSPGFYVTEIHNYTIKDRSEKVTTLWH